MEEKFCILCRHCVGATASDPDCDLARNEVTGRRMYCRHVRSDMCRGNWFERDETRMLPEELRRKTK